MKKVFTFLVALVCFGFSVNAQRSADLVLLNTLRTNDTINYNTGGTAGSVMVNVFINNGPSALTSSDTLYWRSAANGLTRLRLPTAGIPVGDTVYFTDTIIVTAPPTTNPFTWCDSLWAKDNTSTIINDPNRNNNVTCKTVFFRKINNVGISTANTNEEAIAVFPNPANNNMNVSYVFKTNEEAVLVMRDLLGKIVLKKDLGKNITGKQTYSLDISSLSNGIYSLEITGLNTRAVSKVVVSK